MWQTAGVVAAENYDSALFWFLGMIKAKFHYAILVADRFEAGRRPAASWNLAYHLARWQRTSTS